ncbi:hypothetical protein K432DRAFT_382641 [Lepidopterella palustris CBS 459.81]|uniref:Uncharacterized protein n=1 Tax=Lepidopterella palustris CBS 459.81 TaxID=1314670 RepID=A0A8E2E9R9_9PEZI|nr:hypothetical protein K432DRAFT_382641 [Lepidopterella palustris CBS 459.81]
MCFFTTTPTYSVHHGVTDPPLHRSRYSAHPPPGVVRLPRGSSHSYREYNRYRSNSHLLHEPPRLEYENNQSRIEHHTPRSSEQRVEFAKGSQPSVDQYRKSVTYVRQ